jgi:PST family polysaccharide transporter
MSLAWSWGAGQCATTGVLLLYKPGRVRPGWVLEQAKRVLRFGIPLAGAGMLSSMVLNVDYIVVGRALGAAALGLYVLAFNISGWPMNVFGAVVRSVSLPGFAQLRRDGASMPSEFTNALGLVATLTLPICAMVGALALPLVSAVYGEQWIGAAAALTGLAVLGALRILIELTADFLVTLGRTRAVLLAQVPWLIGLTVALILLVGDHGLAGAGLAQAGVALGLMTPIYLVLLRRAGVSVADVGHAVLPPLAWSLAAATIAWATAREIGNPFLATAVGAACGLSFYLAVHRSLIRDTIEPWRAERRNRGLVESPSTT